MLVKEYLEKYGKVIIKENDKKFCSDGVSMIAGVFKARDFKRTGML